MITTNEPANEQHHHSEEGYVQPVTRGFSGKKVIVLMFLFGGTLTAILYGYWTYHTARFRPLQDAITFEFEKSMPRVEGGKRKLHLEDHKAILRVTLKVFFDPNDTSQSEKHADKLTTFIQQHEDITAFDILEYHFYQLNPEQTIKQHTYRFATKDIKPVKQTK